MEMVREMAYEREKQEKGKQKKYHDESVKTRTFSVGDFVLVFRPTQHDKLSNHGRDLSLLPRR